ncbi:peptide/nickel transport system permease protein [Streptomyces sp. SAI-135]|uniref:ABC transporter permease n=1 Tax=unclassified Streptomyces TaxID=2593676 RepID=UPI002473AB29|nr:MULTISPECIES: ABC transporter permease [unclassified Streptomyces]MDH6523313.1 peptide/nickel transport system permease protein [Streptomyces sp. SAI-090]MDH6613074.1 peptide/nickel transport system permease protein [Streptomyces sp. SAI-135]
MTTYLIKRCLQVFPVLFGVSLIAFWMIHAIPGDPAQILLGQTASPDQVARLRASMGLDQSLFVQYGDFLSHAVRGDFGVSIAAGRPVVTELLERLPATLELTACAMIVAIVVGVPVGVISAVRKYSLLDRVLSGVTLAGVSMPIFWLAMILIVFFAADLDLLPFPGRLSGNQSITSYTGLVLVDSLVMGNLSAFWDGLLHLVMPAVALAAFPAAVIMRMTRSSMLEVLDEDYVRTARAKGVLPWRVVLKHAMRNAMLPTLTVMGMQTGLLMGGAMIAETIFSWPGVGQLTYQAISGRDYPVIQAVVLYGAALMVFVNLFVDALYAVLDPRVRYQ